MKRNVLVVVAAVFMFAACEKGYDEPEKENLEDSKLEFSADAPKGDNVNASPFAIDYAGVWDQYLYMSVSYTGGEWGHEFNVTWDGEVTDEGDKKVIALNIYHLTDDDNGTEQISDSLLLSLQDLNISEEIFNDEKLWFKVVNTSDELNAVMVQAYHSNDTGDDNDGNENQTKDIEVVVIKDECGLGLWTEFWLKASSSDDSEKYYLPLALSNDINYSPKENDKLKIDIEFTWLQDSTQYCDSWQNKYIEMVNITELEVVN